MEPGTADHHRTIRPLTVRIIPAELASRHDPFEGIWEHAESGGDIVEQGRDTGRDPCKVSGK